MKFHNLIAIAAFFCLNSLFAQKMDGVVGPKIVTTKPAPTEYFLLNKATKPQKVDRELPVVLTQFNVTIPQDQEFYARTGSGKLDMNDAQLLLKFHISNLDKAKFQKSHRRIG
ncbi:MAG: hypothetical protein IPK03_16055 [Bacteroidetes bacterium]|nr:hypothetical protein [Bacteroidota bacterium]